MRSMPEMGVLASMRSSSESIVEVNIGDGGGGSRGCVVVDASGERAEATRAWAAARDVGEGVRSMSR